MSELESKQQIVKINIYFSYDDGLPIIESIVWQSVVVSGEYRLKPITITIYICEL